MLLCVREQVMDWDRFQADEVIGECRIHLADIHTDNPGIPGKQEARALQIVQPGSNTAIVGKVLKFQFMCTSA
jgi:hypothetical protein